MNTLDCCTKQVEYVSPDTSLTDISRRMRESDCGSILIGENDKLVGVVTDRDIVVRFLAERGDASQATANDVMTNKVLYCFQSDSPEDVLKNMAENKVKRMPVMDESKNLVGIVSFGDLSAACDDKELAGEAMKEIRRAA